MSESNWTEDASVALAEVEQTSQPFVGQWNGLVSTTNWEKGRIIGQWRKSLEESGALAEEFSDEAWSRRVGNISPQHVGRLRRVDARFGDTWQDYPGLFWSHFQSAIEWGDAEMWLEGAVQSKWTVAQMRTQRWETLGKPEGLEPKPEDVVSAEFDEDVAPALDANVSPAVGGSTETVQRPGREETFGPDYGDASEASDDPPEQVSAEARTASATEEVSPVRPFAELAELPADLASAFDAFKLAILHHKMAGWQDVQRDDVTATLDALKELALAP